MSRFANFKADAKDRWKGRPRTNPNTTLRQFRTQARMEGKHLTRADLIAAGYRPKRGDKPDQWKALTVSERERILDRSRRHSEAQLALGIPRDTIYGPWPVTQGWTRWHEPDTYSTLETTDFTD